VEDQKFTLMNQAWFEMAEIRKRKFSKAVWIPLRSSMRRNTSVSYGYLGYREEYSGIKTFAIPTTKKDEALKYSWTTLMESNLCRGYVDDAHNYINADSYRTNSGNELGLQLVLDQYINGNEKRVWHLHQDLVITLRLMREKDIWVCSNEGYVEVARLFRDSTGEPEVLEVRAEFLFDYLCARNMGLYLSSYRSRKEVVQEISHVKGLEKPLSERAEHEIWEGRAVQIHEGGDLYGSSTAVFWAGRKDIDPQEDVPVFTEATEDQMDSDHWEVNSKGPKLFLVMGELWKDEWIDAGTLSTRVRKDETLGTNYFITDSKGKKETKETLVNEESRWLWFKPEVINALIACRGGWLKWYTGNTGAVSASPDGNIHFGINSIGLVNAYAQDVGFLPDWHQRIWAGFNCAPEGGVSEELLASQMEAKPANTFAPEVSFVKSIDILNKLFLKKTGHLLFRSHKDKKEIIDKIHRFRATDRTGLDCDLLVGQFS